jgi:chemotaxis protein methyltransferase CheR
MQLQSSTLSESDFYRLSGFIQEQFGIKLPPAKKVMLESRLQKRLKALHMGDLSEYCDFLFSEEGLHSELHHMIDVVTTNKTDFFREPVHFDYLLQTCIPELIHTYGYGINQPLNIWSAGCSTGEEPYTLAMVLSEFQESYPAFRFNILATDISTQVLEKARLAIYSEDRIEVIPEYLRKKYFLRSKDNEKKVIRIKPAIRALIRFQRFNLMQRSFEIGKEFPIIFCRNVLIYFEKKTQEKLIYKFSNQLPLGGFLFLGHSETLCAMSVPLKAVVPTIYRRV